MINHLPFSIELMPTIFQQIMDTLLTRLNFAVAYLDNVQIIGVEVEHNDHLECV